MAGSHFPCFNKFFLVGKNFIRWALLISSLYTKQAKLGLWPLWKFKNAWACLENFQGDPIEDVFKREQRSFLKVGETHMTMSLTQE